MSDTEIKQYASKLRIDGIDSQTYYLKDAATLSEVQVLRKEMGSWQTQLNSLITQLRALETKVDNQSGTDVTPSTDSVTKEEAEEIAKDAANEALDNKSTTIDTIIGKLNDILSRNQNALSDFHEAEDKAKQAAEYANQSMQYSSESKEYSIKALSQVSPIVADYAYTTADISRCLSLLIEQYDDLNSIKSKVTATTQSLVDGQEQTADFIKKTSESITKSSQTMVAQYNTSQQDSSVADPTADSPLSSTLTRISSTVTQTAQSWGAQVSSFSYQDASQDAETQAKIDQSIKDYEEALAAQEKAYLSLNDATIAYGEAKQWYADAKAYYDSCVDLYNDIVNTSTGNSADLSSLGQLLQEAATKLTNCVAKIKELTGSKDTYRTELQDSILTLVALYSSSESVPDINAALEVVQAKVESIELISDELGVNITTLKVLLEDYSTKLASYLALTQSGDLIDQQLSTVEDLKNDAENALAEAETAIKTASNKYNEALALLQTTADSVDKAANGLVVNQTAALQVRKGEVLGYINTLKESAVTYQKSLCAKYTEFVSAVRGYHTYSDCDVRFWFYSVAPTDCTAQDFVDRFGENKTETRAAYQDYYYNTTDSKAYYWDGSKNWIEIFSAEGEAASALLEALQKAQNYSDIDEDNYRNLYFYNSGYKDENGDTVSPREYSKLSSAEQEKCTIINEGYPNNYQVGDIWYSSIYDTNIAIESITPYYLTYPYATGVSTVNNNEYDNYSVGNWVTNSSDVRFTGKTGENDSDREAPYLWYYCKVAYSNGITVNTQPMVVGSYSSDITSIAITPYVMATSIANSSIKPSNDNWQAFPNGSTFKGGIDQSSNGVDLSNYGENSPYLFTYVKLGKDANSAINSPVVYIDGYTYNNGILAAELERASYTAGDWVNCWVAQSRQIAGGLNKVWDYVNASLTITQNQILSAVKNIAQLENDTYNYTYTGIDQQEDSINLYAAQRKGKASAFVCDTAPTTQVKIAKNLPQTGGILFSPWETIYEQTSYKRVRVVKDASDYWDAQITLTGWDETTKTVDDSGACTSITYNPTDAWMNISGNGKVGTEYSTADGYAIIVSNILENSSTPKGKALVNTTITVNFTYSTDVTYPLLELQSTDGETILEALPIAAYGEWLNNYSSESSTTDEGSVIASNKAYNWEDQSVVSLTLHVPTNLDPTIYWYTEGTASGTYYRIYQPTGVTNVKDKYGKVGLYNASTESYEEVGDIYWEICDSSGLQKSSSLKIELDKITAQVQDINEGMTKLTLNPDGFNVNISSTTHRSDRQLLEVPDSSQKSISTDGTPFALVSYGFEWTKAVDTSGESKIIRYVTKDDKLLEGLDSTGSNKYETGRDTTVKYQYVYYGGTSDNSGNVTGYAARDKYCATYDGTALTVTPGIVESKISASENIGEGMYYPPFAATTKGSDFYSFVNTTGSTGYVVFYNNKIIPFEANLSYRVGCYVNTGGKNSAGKLNVYLGKPPVSCGSVTSSYTSTSGSSAIAEASSVSLNKDGNVESANIKANSGWQYVYMDFTFNNLTQGAVLVEHEDVVVGSRITFEINTGGTPCAVTGFHVTCLDAAKGVNNYMRMTAEDGLIIGDMTKNATIGTGSYYATQDSDTPDCLNANIQLTVGKSTAVQTDSSEDISIADPSINLRYNADELVNISAIDATTFKGYKIGKQNTDGSYDIASDDNRWVKITSQLQGGDKSTNVDYVAGGAPGILIYNSNATSDDNTDAKIRKHTGAIGMFALNSESITKKYNKKANSFSGLGLITGNNFLIAAGNQGKKKGTNTLSKGMIGFQTDKKTLYNSNKDWTNGAVIYKGQHIYGKNSWVYGLWYFKRITKTCSKRTIKKGAITSIDITINSKNGYFYPGAVREISFPNNEKKLCLMNYKCNKQNSTKYTFTVWVKNMTSKPITHPKVRIELLMFRKEHK